MTFYTNGTADCIALEKTMKEQGIDYVVCDDDSIMKQKGIIALPCVEDEGRMIRFANVFSYIKNYKKAKECN